ncbi:MAG: FecR domain-containing protein [Pirellulales bacterium]|nr:FecR domain-containing protein [Pirellulales bacterium]
MATLANKSDDSELPPELLREVNGLLSQLCDELLEVDGVNRLGDLLLAEPAVRRRYLRYVALHSTLGASAGSCAAVDEEDEAPAALAIFDGEQRACLAEYEDAAEPANAARIFWRRLALPAAAAILLALSVAGWSLYSSDEPILQRATEPLVASHEAPGQQTPKPLAAEITYASSAIRWQRTNESYALTSRVRAGQTLALALGSVELTYGSGTTLTLTGPSEFVVEENGGMLQRGEIVAHVTEKGHGFTIHTPHGKIIDRGTAFGVVVDDFGVSEVSVFEGRVEAFPVVGSAPTAPKIDLTTGRMLQWSGDSIIAMNAGHRTLPTEFSGRTPQITPTVLLDVPSGTQAIDPNQWTTLGKIHPVRGGLRLDGRANPTERPYLITAHQYDPSRGPILIACDVRFDEIDSHGQPGFSILTRGAGDRSKPATPWHDMLASCVRCSLTADLSSGEGLLEAGAKYEFDREPHTISWRGFTRPRAGVTYHLQIRDDGLSVSFTASEADNASVSKTVTCRSLFRGSQNFIALEGFAGGVATVSNVRITQNRSRIARDGSAAENSEMESIPARSPSAAVEQEFADALPADAVLRIAASFDAENLDAARWMTLGDTVVKDRALHLGVANPEQHIDTWRQRPYLLTREMFDPAESPVTIVGRASFAPNFLHGYGGSFAVLTRAEADYGAGPGWEQSALRRGVRANFWPAALGQNRSLELFEMLSPEPLNLLATADFPIDPHSRSYFFCIHDDGVNAKLTLVDAENLSLRKTLTHATQSPLLSAGHIAFEGCWGAPVQLDDVRIYESSQRETPASLLEE